MTSRPDGHPTLTALIPRYQALGYTLVEQGRMTARLQRRPTFAGGIMAIFKGTNARTILLMVDGSGNVRGGRGTWICGSCGDPLEATAVTCPRCKRPVSEEGRLPA